MFETEELPRDGLLFAKEPLRDFARKPLLAPRPNHIKAPSAARRCGTQARDRKKRVEAVRSADDRAPIARIPLSRNNAVWTSISARYFRRTALHEKKNVADQPGAPAFDSKAPARVREHRVHRVAPTSERRGKTATCRIA